MEDRLRVKILIGDITQGVVNMFFKEFSEENRLQESRIVKGKSIVNNLAAY